MEQAVAGVLLAAAVEQRSHLGRHDEAVAAAFEPAGVDQDIDDAQSRTLVERKGAHQLLRRARLVE